MSVHVRGEGDESIDALVDALRGFCAGHPAAEVVLYRRDPYSVRVRVIDPGFAGRSLADRFDSVWEVIEPLPEDLQSQVSILLTLTPEEAETMSIANYDFDHPIPLDR